MYVYNIVIPEYSGVWRQNLQRDLHHNHRGYTLAKTWSFSITKDLDIFSLHRQHVDVLCSLQCRAVDNVNGYECFANETTFLWSHDLSVQTRKASNSGMINDSSRESIMHQQALHWRKNTRSCQWIHKSSTVHMDTLCGHMFHALLILLTLYCSAHLLYVLHMMINLRTHSLNVSCSLSIGCWGQ